MNELKPRFSDPFWFGALLALPPGIFSITFVGYAGYSLVNGLWLGLFHHDAPVLIVFSFGALYGVVFGLGVSAIAVGVLCHLIWARLCRIEFVKQYTENASMAMLVVAWIVLEAIYCVSKAWIALPILAYAIGGYGAGALGVPGRN